MGAHRRRDEPGAAMDQPAFDEVAQGYDRRQVDDYLGVLWRYANEVTSRAAAAESALRHERDRREAVERLAEGLPAQAGGRIGLMLEIAQREADEIISGAREIAQTALREAVVEAGASHPIVREAREQAEKLLLDAVEESRRLALARHEDLEAQITRDTHSLEALRRQQGEIVGAVLRLRRLLGEDEIDRAVTDLVRAGISPEDIYGPAGGAAPAGEPAPGPYAAGSPAGAGSRAAGAGGPSTAGSAAFTAAFTAGGTRAAASGDTRTAAPGDRAPDDWAGAVRRGPGRHRQQRDVADAEPYPAAEPAGGFGPVDGQEQGHAPGAAGMAAAGYRPAREEDILDAEIVEE
ncbi:hypothetical protein UG55_100534 [Frankia sp. EI5c]|uniref:DivIVA domain-containing protein n=1 Tax=Frankia sp. EI5c TaxID=683316 RepID=UPI0007C35DDE|nr:hypothetical protein [Frankia sp. EI5c]OAA28522.1 hypothetical protein UG55_100534 [Frankia sp. EI5c]